MPSYYTYDSSNLRERNKYTSTVESKAYGIKRYFSSIDAAVYFGADAVEEIVAIDFTVQEPKLPISGYNSFYPNRLIAGRRTITGTFAINFTRTDYLLEILKSIDDSILANDYDSIINRCNGNNPLFEKEFDITIGYGYSKIDAPSYGASMQSLLGVRIVEYRQALDTEGNPILDMYSFIAKDIEIGNKNVNQLQIEDDNSLMLLSDEGDEAEETTNFEDLDYIVANYYVEEERNTLSARCVNNAETWGILLTPTLFNQGSMYYARIDVEHSNKPSKIIIDNLKATLVNQSLGINQSCSMTFNKQYTFNGSNRDQIKKLFSDEENVSIKATIEFDVIIGGKTYPVTKETFFLVNNFKTV